MTCSRTSATSRYDAVDRSIGDWPPAQCVIALLAYLGIFSFGAVKFFRWS